MLCLLTYWRICKIVILKTIYIAVFFIYFTIVNCTFSWNTYYLLCNLFSQIYWFYLKKYDTHIKIQISRWQHRIVIRRQFYLSHISVFIKRLSRTEISFALATSVKMYFAWWWRKKKRRQRKKYEDPGWNVREVVSEQPPTVVQI